MCNKLFYLLPFSFLFFTVNLAEADFQNGGSVVAADEKELEDLKNNMLKAYEGNIDDLLPYLHPEIVVTWQDATVTKGPQEVKEYYAKKMLGPDSVVFKVTGNPTVEDRRIFGGQIVSFGKMNDTFILRGKEAEPLNFNSRFSSLVVRHEGKLKLAGMHMSINAFDNPITKYAIGSIKKIAVFSSILALLLGLGIGRYSARKV